MHNSFEKKCWIIISVCFILAETIIVRVKLSMQAIKLIVLFFCFP